MLNNFKSFDLMLLFYESFKFVCLFKEEHT